MEIKPSAFTVDELAEWQSLKSLILVPKFQRREVWSLGAKSYLVDTLLQALPVPPIYFRIRHRDDLRPDEYPGQAKMPALVREVIDGQQRIRAVLDYLDGKYSLVPTLKASYAGKAYNELSKAERRRIDQYSFQCQNMRDVSDELVIQIFARLNTYTVKLNKQELRNGKYFGLFKQLSYSLGADYLEFWRRKGIFADGGIARMLEVELTSELLIAGLHGMQDKKKSIDEYYERYDPQFRAATRAERRFRYTLSAIDEAVGEDLRDLEFRRPPLFYTLYCVVYHRAFGVPGESVPSTPRRELRESELRSLRDALIRLSEILVDAREEEEYPERYTSFVNACLRQTDNINPRRTRFREVYRQAF